MPSDLHDLLFEYEERRERGETPTPAELCPDRPELWVELARLIALLERSNRLFEPNGDATTSSMTIGPELLPTRVARYRVRGMLGRGGNSVVYRAWDEEHNREIAVKLLAAEGPAGPVTGGGPLARRFSQEGRLLARLKHEYIVPVYESGMHGNRPYLVMECIGGGNLADRRAEFTAAGPALIAPFMARVALAVEFAHAAGVLHRDLKPANILLTHADDLARVAPRVSDFGLATLLDADTESTAVYVDRPDTITSDQTPFEISPFEARRSARSIQPPGTPAYMAPEQFDPNRGPVGPPADIWALGVILYELLIGEKPFNAANREELAHLVCTKTVVFDRPIDANMRAIVQRCLQKNAAKRYGSARELARDLAWWRPRRRLRRTALTLGIAAIMALTALMAAWASPDVRRAVREGVQSRAFRRSGEIDLLASSVNRPTIRYGGPDVQLDPTTDGYRIESPSRVALVEFLPRVSAIRYRMRVVLTLESSSTPHGLCGVYFHHTPLQTLRGTQHYFHSAHFADTWRNPADADPGRVAVCSTVLAAHLCSDSIDERTGLARQAVLPTDYERSVIEYTRDGLDGPERVVEVTIEGSDHFCRFDAPGTVPSRAPDPLLSDRWPAINESLIRQYPDLKESLRGDWRRGSAIGIFVSRAACRVRLFRIERIDD